MRFLHRLGPERICTSGWVRQGEDNANCAVKLEKRHSKGAYARGFLPIDCKKIDVGSTTLNGWPGSATGSEF